MEVAPKGVILDLKLSKYGWILYVAGSGYRPLNGRIEPLIKKSV